MKNGEIGWTILDSREVTNPKAGPCSDCGGHLKSRARVFRITEAQIERVVDRVITHQDRQRKRYTHGACPGRE